MPTKTFVAGSPVDPSKLAITWRPPAELHASPRNARTHPKRQIKQMGRSIEIHGFYNPILVDEAGIIIAGHARKLAAEQLGLAAVPVIVLSGLCEAQKRALMLADNKHALNSGWDEDILATELRALQDIGYDLELTGFPTSEIDKLFENVVESPGSDPAVDDLPPLAKRPVSRTGDLFALGKSRLLCGSALSGEDYALLMGAEPAEAAFMDPPYNVRIAGNVSGLGKHQHGEFAMASGEMNSEQFTEFLTSCMKLAAEYSTSPSIAFVCMDWKHLVEVITAGKAAYDELKNVCVWVKNNAGMGTFYRSQHEEVLVFKKGDGAHRNNFELGQHGRHRSNVWRYAGMNSFGAGRDADLALHPTVKPVAMIADAIRDVTKRNGIVLDPFGGSGSTLIAAHQTGRQARLIELDPLYVDRTIARWEAFAHDDAILLSTGQTFAELKAERLAGEV